MTITAFIVALESPAGKLGTINFFFCLILQPISHGGFPLEAPRPGEQEKGVFRVALTLQLTTMGWENKQ